MVKSSVALLCKSTSSLKRRKIDETPEQYLRQITHLYLNGKQIEELGDEINLCKNLNVLYLYDNRIRRIPQLSGLTQLTHLYLQNNQLNRIENLNRLEKLEKLFLGRNSISVVEGLDELKCLQELRIDNQRLYPGESLIFDEATLMAIGKTLSRLDVSGNRLDALNDLSHLKALTYLCASDNNLTDLDDLVGTLKAMPYLRELDLQSNPVMTRPRIRDAIIVSAKSLEILNNKEISLLTRQFLENWNQYKGLHQDTKCLDLGDKPEHQSLPDMPHSFGQTGMHLNLDKINLSDDSPTLHTELGQGESPKLVLPIQSVKSAHSLPIDTEDKSRETSRSDIVTTSGQGEIVPSIPTG